MAVLEGILQISGTFPLLIAVLWLLFVYLHFSGGRGPEEGKEPPGPKALPFLGNLLQLDLKQPYRTLCELSKKYGSVFTIHLGPKKVVVLSGYKTVKQALVNHAEEFGDRDITPLFHDINKGHGILFANGDSWKEMRRFALTNMRDFGMGKKGSEEKIIEETQSLKDVFEKFNGVAFDTTQPVNYAVSNIICAIVYGRRFEYDDPKFRAMVKRANDNIRLTGSPSVQLYNMFPWLKPWVRNLKQILMNAEVHEEEMKRIIRDLQDTLNPQELRGFVDSFLVRKQSAEESGQMDSLFHEKNLIYCVTNLFAAGTDTSGTTLRWGLLLMAKYPHIQERVHEEIDRVIGGRQPTIGDRKSLPYTDAVIHEIQRVANIVPLSLPHTTSCDTNFQDFFIKKVAGRVWARVWPGWNSSSSSQLFFNASVSLLLPASPRTSWTSHQL
ncbi:cytochrome P450 2K1-like isoform X2 [Alosa sapidissima]|uniref:cytochrome P450 2K1-like isoform X2 n=1 Tax=Alosa sapidissima TaxID=34773 RepID=UPI001C09B477|nr:cytochrome P450 2K1-like isoform X2 [Alosa sapidissima]